MCPSRTSGGVADYPWPFSLRMIQDMRWANNWSSCCGVVHLLVCQFHLSAYSLYFHIAIYLSICIFAYLPHLPTSWASSTTGCYTRPSPADPKPTFKVMATGALKISEAATDAHSGRSALQSMPHVTHGTGPQMDAVQFHVPRLLHPSTLPSLKLAPPQASRECSAVRRASTGKAPRLAHLASAGRWRRTACPDQMTKAGIPNQATSTCPK